MSQGKRKRAKYMKDNTSRNAERQRKRVAKKFGNDGRKTTFSAREARRLHGDFKPVNPLASVTQAPEGAYARSLSKQELQKLRGEWVDPKATKELQAA